MKVGELMTTAVVSISQDESVERAAKEMESANVGVVLATNNGKLAGILVDRAIVTKVVARGLNPKTTKVREVMTPKPITASPDIDVMDAAQIMGKNKFRRLPVVSEKGEILGVLSISDVAEYAKYLSCWIYDEISKSAKKTLLKGRP